MWRGGIDKAKFVEVGWTVPENAEWKFVKINRGAGYQESTSEVGQ